MAKKTAGGREQLKQLRARITELQAIREDIAAAPVTLKEGLARIDEMIAAKAGGITAGGLPKVAVHSLSLPECNPSAFSTLRHDDPESMLAAIVPDALRAFLHRELEAHLAGLPAGIEAGERATRLAELDRDLRKAELAEEELVCTLEAEGFEVARRPDADPAVVLEARYEDEAA